MCEAEAEDEAKNKYGKLKAGEEMQLMTEAGKRMQ